MRSYAIRALLGLTLGAVLAGCEQEPFEAPPQVRPIRAFKVTELASGQQRRFSGLIEAVDSSTLSFQVGGNVREVRVNQGDSVQAGQVLATLDREPFQLGVQAAEAELQRERAFRAQARSDFERHQRLLAQRAVSQVQFEVAQRNYQSSLSQVDFATARLDLARRDLRNTSLTAPFAGSVAARLIDPFVDVAPAQAAFRLDAAGGRQARIGVPETSISQVTLGMPATLTVPNLAQPVQARVSEIGSSAAAGNTFPVNVVLIQPPAAVRPGMTAEVTLTLPQANQDDSTLLPLSAIAPGDRTGEGFVFIYDPGTSTVRRTPVSASGTLTSNMVAVTGVAVGDVVASAGVNFLIDGQKVRLIDPLIVPASAAAGSQTSK